MTPRAAAPCLLLAVLLLGACAGSGRCESPYAGSPQFDRTTCRFRNPPNPEPQVSMPAWRNWLRFVFAAKDGTVPVDPIPLRQLAAADLRALPDDGVHVVRLGHSSQLFKLHGRYVLVDPVFGERASPFSFAGPKRFHPPPIALAELPPIALLLLSHDHYDHLDRGTLAALDGRVGRYAVPLGVAERLTSLGIARERIVELDWWQSLEVDGIKVTATPAQHFSGRTLWDRDETLWAGWAFESRSARLFFSGDSGWFPGFRDIGERLGPFDLALLENGAYDAGWPAVHLAPERTLQAAVEVRAKLLVGVHNSTFDLAFHRWQEPLERLADLAEAKGLPVVSPVIGEVVTLGQAQQNVRWWRGLR